MSPLLDMLTACKAQANAFNDENNYEEKVDAEYEDESEAQSPNGAESPNGNSASTSTKEKVKDDIGQYLGSLSDGTEIRSQGLPVETVKAIKAHMKHCQHTVDRECTFFCH